MKKIVMNLKKSLNNLKCHITFSKAKISFNVEAWKKFMFHSLIFTTKNKNKSCCVRFSCKKNNPFKTQTAKEEKIFKISKLTFKILSLFIY